jgi:hypothetical protein
MLTKRCRERTLDLEVKLEREEADIQGWAGFGFVDTIPGS